MQLTLMIRTTNSATIMQISGDVEKFWDVLYHLVPKLLDNAPTNESKPAVIFDLRNLTALSDTEKAYLIAIKTGVRKSGGRFALLNISNAVAKTLEISRITTVFKQFPSWKLRTSRRYLDASKERKLEFAEDEAIEALSRP